MQMPIDLSQIDPDLYKVSDIFHKAVVNGGQWHHLQSAPNNQILVTRPTFLDTYLRNHLKLYVFSTRSYTQEVKRP